MTRNNAVPNKTGASYDDKHAVVELTDGRTIDAAHHFVSEDGDRLHLYISERAGGIDVTIPLTGSHARAWARSDVGRDALGIDTGDAQDDADGAHDDGDAEEQLRSFKETARSLGNDKIGAYGDPQTDESDDLDIEEGVVVVAKDQSGPLGDDRWEVIHQSDRFPSDIRILSLETGEKRYADANYFNQVTDTDDLDDDGVDRGDGLVTDGGRDMDHISYRHGFTGRIGEAVRIIRSTDAAVPDDYDELDVPEYDDGFDDRRSWVLAEIVDRVAGVVVIARANGDSIQCNTDDLANDAIVKPGGEIIGSEAEWPFPYDAPEDDDTDDVDRGDGVATDGGRDVTDCPGCGADLIETGEIGTELVPAPGAREPFPRMVESPMAECGECGRYFGGAEGWASVKALWSARGEPLPGEDDSGDEDGGDGRDAVKVAEDVDYVEYDGDGYLVYGAVTREELEICQVNRRPITVPVDECTPTDVRGTPLDEDDESDDDVDRGRGIEADGGRDIDGCPGCGADLIEHGAIGTELVPAPGAREPHPRMIKTPVVDCGECGRIVGAANDWESVKAVWDFHDESMPGEDDSDDEELVTDDGRDTPPSKICSCGCEPDGDDGDDGDDEELIHTGEVADGVLAAASKSGRTIELRDGATLGTVVTWDRDADSLTIDRNYLMSDDDGPVEISIEELLDLAAVTADTPEVTVGDEVEYGIGTVTVEELPSGDNDVMPGHVRVAGWGSHNSVVDVPLEKVSVPSDDDGEDTNDGCELVTDGGRATHDVVYCNCGRGMSVPLTENEPEDGWTCGKCKRQSEWKKHSRESREIRETADVEPGDKVVYDGAIWTFDDWGPWHCVELQAVDGSIARGIDVRDVDTVPEDCEPPVAEPRYDVREEYGDDAIDRGDGVMTDGGIDAGDEDLADIDTSDLSGVEIAGANTDGDPDGDSDADTDAGDEDGDAPTVDTGDMADTVELGDDADAADMFEALNEYSDEEIENAVDCSEIMIDTYVDKRFTTNTPDGDDGGPYGAEDLKWLAGKIDAGKQIDVHVRLLDKREQDDGSIEVLVADTTAAVTIEIPEQLRPSDSMGPSAEFDAGDVVVVENVETMEANNEHYSELRWGFDAEATVIDEWDRPASVPVGVTVDETSRLVNDCERYSYEDHAKARGRVVDTIVDEFHVKHIMDSEETWTWVGETAWAPRGDKRIEKRLAEYLPDAVNTRTERKEILARVELAAQTDENPFTPDPPEGADLKWKTPVLNGLVDLREGPEQEVEPHAPEHHTTLPEVLNVEHDPDADCPAISDNLDKIARDDIMRATIEEMMANILMRNNDYRKAYACYGDEKTGKSFIDSLLKWLIGDDGIEHMRFTRFIGKDDFEDDSARHSYAVLDDDSSGKAISTEECAAFKRFVGSGGTRTGAKDVQRESYDPYATIKLNMNELPVWKAWDGSIQSRIMPIFFTQQFVSNPDPDANDEYQSKKESELERELRTDEELSGLLNVIIEAANRLRETDEWSVYERYYADLPERDPEDAHDELMRKYRNYADTTRRFARKFMVEADEAVEVRKEDWYTLYRRWCDEHGVDPQSKSKFWEQIGNDDTVYVETKNPYQAKRVTLYVAPSKKALDYAPTPVKDRIEDLVESTGFNTGIDETTPITDLPRGSDYVTVEGEVVTVTMEPDPRDGNLKGAAVIEDDSGGRVTLLSPKDESIASGMIDDELGEAFDEIVPGSIVRVFSAISLREGPYLRVQDGSSSIDIVDQPTGEGSSGTGLPDDESGDEDGDADDGEDSGVRTGDDVERAADARKAMQNIVASQEMRDDLDGARPEHVIEAAESKGVPSPEQTLERLKANGEVYEIDDAGRLRAVGGEE